MYQRPHKELLCWQASRLFVKAIYEYTRLFPSEERFGITSQLRRASVSIPLNIAEGAARRTTKGSDAEFLHFLNIANGSAAEVDTLLDICLDLDYLNTTDFETLQAQLDYVSKLVYGLIRSLKPAKL